MEYNETAFVKDFVERTYENLQYIRKAKEDGRNVFEFTQLVNSLLGLLVIPQQKKYKKINDSYLDAHILAQLKNCIKHDDYKCGKFSQILRHMRNAIAHGTIKASSEDGEISSIKFTDKNPSGKKKFVIELTTDELHKFIDDFVKKLRDNL